jgi:HK97 family phage prohead protease
MIMERKAPKVGEHQTRATTISDSEHDDGKARRISFVASDESVDRYGDIIRVAGWQLDTYRTNPLLLFGHDASAVPIGKVVNIGVTGKQLVAEAEFRPEGDSAFADDVWKAVDGGFLNAVSVGFMPTKEPRPIWKDGDRDKGYLTGFEFISQELLELSVVPVPANPQALAIARGLGFSAEVQRRLFVNDERASARVDAERRARSITLARLRPVPRYKEFTR